MKYECHVCIDLHVCAMSCVCMHPVPGHLLSFYFQVSISRDPTFILLTSPSEQLITYYILHVDMVVNHACICMYQLSLSGAIQFDKHQYQGP